MDNKNFVDHPEFSPHCLPIHFPKQWTFRALQRLDAGAHCPVMNDLMTCKKTAQRATILVADDTEEIFFQRKQFTAADNDRMIYFSSLTAVAIHTYHR